MIVVLAHGSPDPRHAAGVEKLVAGMARLLGGVAVTHAYLQHHGPHLASAASTIPVAPHGALATTETVWVLPLLLSEGVHVTHDVPELLVEATLARPDLDWRLLPALPPQTLALAVLSMLAQAADGASAASRLRGVVGVVAGSSRAGALTGFEALASSLRVAGVEMVVANGPAHISAARDLLVDVGADQVTVLPLMFADGFLADRAARRATDEGLRILPPVGESVACIEALASWVAAHVSHATAIEPRGVAVEVDVAP